MNKNLKLIKRILFNPKAMSFDSKLGDYNMESMNKLIRFLAVLLWIIVSILNIGFRVGYLLFFINLIFGSIILYVLALSIKKMTIIIYKNILQSGVIYDIPFHLIEKILTPYYAALLFLTIILVILGEIFIVIQSLIGLILLSWFNIQIYYIVIYRINNRNLKAGGLNTIVKKLTIIVIILVITKFGGLSMYTNHLENPSPKLDHQIKKIRTPIYNKCNDIFKKIDFIIREGNGMSYDKLNGVKSKIFDIVNYNQLDKPVRGIELDLIRILVEMANTANEIYVAQNGIKNIDTQGLIRKYESLKMKAIHLMREYHE